MTIEFSWNIVHQLIVLFHNQVAVPTSLCEGDSEEKQVAILTVNQNKFKFKPVTLETTRLVIFDTVSLLDLVTLDELEDHSNDDIQETIKQGLHLEVEKRIKQAEEMLLDVCIPSYYGISNLNGVEFIKMEHLTSTNNEMSIIDVKLGSKTYLKIEENNKLRADLYQKVI